MGDYMSDTFVISGPKPAWLRFDKFQGPTHAEERQALSLSSVKGKQFKRNQCGHRRGNKTADSAGQWGFSGHRNLNR
jgi:hypothetical protein